MFYRVTDHTVYRAGTYNGLSEALLRYQIILEAGHRPSIVAINDEIGGLI